MRDVEMGGTAELGRGDKAGSVSKEAEEDGKVKGPSSSEKELVSHPHERELPPLVLSVVISQPEMVAAPKVGLAKTAVVGGDKDGKAVASKKGSVDRCDSYHEVCRVCQQQTEEALMDLGCRCRGELAKAHRSCIDIWFRTKGSNKCEICQQTASNVPCPASQPNSTYWVWRVDTSGGSNIGHRGCGCFNPLWIAFTILIGGLLLDVLISVSLGVSALPVNIIIGVLIVLGLGTAFRLTLECCHEWSLRRNHMVDATVNSGYPPTV